MFGANTQLIVADRCEPDREHPRAVAAGLYGDLPATLTALASAVPEPPRGGIGALRTVETEARAAEVAELADDRTPLHPMRVYAELMPLLDHDAIIVIDAGDFGSYAGRVIDSYTPGRGWTAGRSAAWGRVPATHWRPSWPARTARWCCCRATGRSGSPGWSGTPWCATVCTVSVVATTASGAGEAPDGDGLRLLGGGRSAPWDPL